jgi:DDE superfamily endonuclease
MLPFVGVPKTIADGMSAYREVFCREAGFEQVSRYVSGLLLSQNKTLQGIHAQQVYLAGKEVSRRAMHAAVFEAGWDSEVLMQQHRLQVGEQHQGRGREIISLDWTLSHHESGKHIYGVKRAYDYVNHCMSCFQTVVTAVVANPQHLDGIAVDVQLPDFSEAERRYLQMTAQPSYEQMEAVMQRVLELLHYQKNLLSYRKRTEMVVDMVRQIEAEGAFSNADYAFDNGVLTLALTQLIEASGKHWVSEIECSRLVLWNGSGAVLTA